MLRFLIYGITKDDGSYTDPDAAIDEYYYWYYDFNSNNWYQGQDYRQNVVDKVKYGVAEAYTYRHGKTGARCVVRISPYGIEYLKTTPNGDPCDNLSSLPEM